MTVARDIMTHSPQVVEPTESARQAAQIMADYEIGGVVVSDKGHLQGMITDRDLAVGVLAKGLDPEIAVGELLGSDPVITIDVEDPIEQVVETMKRAAVRRVPVTENGLLVGIVSQADLATRHETSVVGDMVGAISAAPDNTAKH